MAYNLPCLGVIDYSRQAPFAEVSYWGNRLSSAELLVPRGYCRKPVECAEQSPVLSPLTVAAYAGCVDP